MMTIEPAAFWTGFSAALISMGFIVSLIVAVLLENGILKSWRRHVHEVTLDEGEYMNCAECKDVVHGNR